MCIFFHAQQDPAIKEIALDAQKHVFWMIHKILSYVYTCTMSFTARPGCTRGRLRHKKIMCLR